MSLGFITGRVAADVSITKMGAVDTNGTYYVIQLLPAPPDWYFRPLTQGNYTIEVQYQKAGVAKKREEDTAVFKGKLSQVDFLNL